MRPSRLTASNAPPNLKLTGYYVGKAYLFAVFAGFMIAVGLMVAGK